MFRWFLSRVVLAMFGFSLVAVASCAEPPPAEKDSVDRDYTDELPRIAPVEPNDALGTFKIASGFRLDLMAHEPLVVDPIAMSFDEDGRLFTVEMRGYSEQGGEGLGRVRRLEDSDGDGKFDKSTVYVDKLFWPTAVCCYDGGVFVAAAPDIWYCKDTSGNGQADVRRKVFTGFGRSNVQGLVNTFVWGLDNRIHGATSSSGATVKRLIEPGQLWGTDANNGSNTKNEFGSVSLRGRDFSFDPRRLDLRPESGGAQHGMSFNDWGEKFVCSNSDHLQLVMFQERYLARNVYVKAPSARISIAADGPQADVFRASPVEPWRIVRTRLRKQGIVPGPVERGGKAAGYFTGSTGVTICRGSAFAQASGGRQPPETGAQNQPTQGADAPRSPELYGCAIVGDVGSNLVHRKRLEPNGLAYVGRRIDEKSELVASTDIWFRPVQFANGPDGGLYIADMYREVIEHPKSLAPVIKKHLDLTAGRDRGRIYRLVPDGFKQPAVPKMSAFNTKQLVKALQDPNAWHRLTASRLLCERGDRSAIGPLCETLSAALPQARIHAMYVLEALGAHADRDMTADEHPQVRRHAIRHAESYLADSPAMRSRLCEMVDDENLHVRYQLAFTLGEFRGAQRDKALTALLIKDYENPWMRMAVRSSMSEGSGAALLQLVRHDDFLAAKQSRAILRDLAAQIGRQQRPDDVAAVVQTLAELAEVKGDELTAVILQGLAAKEGSPLRGKIAAASGGRFDERVEQLIAESTARSLDGKATTEARVAAIHQLRLGKFQPLRASFDKLLDPQQPAAVQTAALDTVVTFDAPEAADILIARWPTLTPSLRRRVADALFTRSAWAERLLTALEEKHVRTGDLGPQQLALFQKFDDPGIVSRYNELMQKGLSTPRQQVVEAYQAALEMQGDVERGRAIFRKHCAACHKLEGIGHELGPQLAAAAGRGGEFVLSNVLNPNREVNPQYVSYVLITKDGRSLSGMIAGETATSITLDRGDEKTDTVLRIDIDELRSTGQSLMPEGFEKQIDQQGMADLLTYLQGLAVGG